MAHLSGLSRRGSLWFLGLFCRHGMENSHVVTWVVPKGFQTLLSVLWECPAPLGTQRSPLIVLFDVRSVGKTLRVPVVFFPDALCPEGWAKSSYGVIGSWRAVLFTFRMWECGGSAEGSVQQMTGPTMSEGWRLMGRCGSAPNSSHRLTCLLLNQGQKYKRVKCFLSRTCQLFSRSPGETPKSTLEITMHMRARANVRRGGRKPCGNLRETGLDAVQQDRASAALAGSNPMRALVLRIGKIVCVSQRQFRE